MKCFICERSIQADDQGVHDATVWRTSGNYGSRVYDPFTEGTFLELAICDDCLSARKQLIEEVVTIRRVDEVSRRPAQLP